MGKHSPIAAAPRYMAQFQCAGSACPETCCAGWNVDIDKATYQKYRTVRIEPLASQLKQSVVKLESPKPHSFAVIQMLGDGSCPMLSPEKLCGIQSQLGAQMLSNTCAQYPRYHAKREGSLFSVHATLSCPEAARLALTDPRSMEMQPMELAFPNAERVPLQVLRYPNANQRDALSACSELLREASLAIIRIPELGAAEALIIVGMLVRSCAALSKEAGSIPEGVARIERKIGAFLDPALLSEILSQLNAAPINVGVKILLLRDATARYLRLFASDRPSSFKEQIALALRGLEYRDEDPEGVAARFDQARQEWFEPFDSARPHLLKNYLLNDIGKRLFPMGTHDEVEEELMSLGVRFSLIKMYLVGVAAAKREAFGEQDYIDTVYTLTRHLEHNDRYMKNVLSVLEENGLNNLASMAVFAK